METSIGPRLEGLGPVPALHVDLVRLAVLVFLVDRSVLRERGTGFRWDRELELTVPVSDPAAWSAVADELEHHLHVLTGNWWTVSSRRSAHARRERPPRSMRPTMSACSAVGRTRSPVRSQRTRRPAHHRSWCPTGTSPRWQGAVGPGRPARNAVGNAARASPHRADPMGSSGRLGRSLP